MKRARPRLKGGGSQDWLPHRAASRNQKVFPKPGGRKRIAQGASPGSVYQICQPRHGAKEALVSSSSAPFRGSPVFHAVPSAHALGYYVTPLRGWGCERIVTRYEELEEL